MDPASDQSVRDRQLEDVLHQYLQAVDNGRAPDREALLQEHPELRAELAVFFASQDEVARLARGMADPVGPAAGVADTATLAPGTGAAASTGITVRYFEDYELIEEIARGGMGVVYRARQGSLNRIVALKMILSGRFASPEGVQRFRTEAEVAAHLDHPNIVPLYEVGQHEGQHYLSMKFVDGGSLSQKSEARSQNSEVGDQRSEVRGQELGSKERQRWAARVVMQVARAVHYAHQRGILHRDLKPSNILLDVGGEPYVTDFGLAKRVEGGCDLTQSGAIVGTPSYMAPEQARSEKVLTTGVDVYSLGAILYELLTGRPPFRAQTPLDTILEVLEGDAEPPRKLNPRVDRDLENICLKCLEKDPRRRYDSAAALADDLQHWLAGEPISARPGGTWERVWKYARRKPAAAALIFVSSLAALALVATLSVSVFLISRKEAEASAALQAERRTSYAQRVGRAYNEWQASNLDGADRLLAECPSDLRGWEWNYLYRLCHAEERTYGGHAERVRNMVWPIKALAFASDGRRVASLDWGGLVKLWDPETCQDIASFQLDGDNITIATFSPDLRKVAWVSLFNLDPPLRVQKNIEGWRKTIQVWDMDAGKRLVALKGHPTDRINALAFSPDGQRLASSCTADEHNTVLEQVKIWDLTTGRELQTVGSGKGSCCAECLAFSPDGHCIATGDWGLGQLPPAVRVWDIQSGRELQTLPIDRGVAAVAYSPDGKRLAASCGTTMRIWDAASGREMRTVPGAGAHLVFSPDGAQIATDGPGPNVVIRDVASGAEQVKFRGSFGLLAFNPNGRQLAAVSQDHWVKLLDAHNHPEARTLCQVHFAYYRGLTAAWSPDSKMVAVSRLGFDIPSPTGFQWRWGAAAFDAQTGRQQFRVICGPKLPDYQLFMDAAFSSDGQRLATLGLGGSGNEQVYAVRVYDVQTQKEQTTVVRSPFDGLIGHEMIAFCDEDRRLVFKMGHKPASGIASYVEVCSASDGETAFIIENVDGTPAVTRDGRRLATIHKPDRCQIWDAASGQRLTVIQPKGDGENIQNVVFSADGRQLALVGATGIAVYQVDSGKELLRIRPGFACDRAAFSPDGKRLATGSGSGVITLWDTVSGQEVLMLRGHSGAIVALSFSPDGRFLCSASAEGSVKVWEALAE